MIQPRLCLHYLIQRVPLQVKVLEFKCGLPDTASPDEVSMVQGKIGFAFYLISGSVIPVFALFPCSQQGY